MCIRDRQTTITTATNTQAGTLSSPSVGARVASTGGLQFLEHSTPAVSSTSSTFSATWVAPVAGTGTVTVYGVGMAANGNGGTSGDNVSSAVAVSFTEVLSDVFTIDTVVACDTYTWIDGNTYTSSTNLPKDTINLTGYDSIITLDLTINSSSTGTDTQSACDSYTWIDGTTYTASNTTATDTLVNAAGCDSVVTLNLTITNSSTSRDVQTACNSFTWINGVTYTANTNSVTDTLTNAAGCDSIITLDLRITSIDTNLTLSGSILTSDEITPGATFQWIDCGTCLLYTSDAADDLTRWGVLGRRIV